MVKTTGPNAGMSHWQSPALPVPKAAKKQKEVKSHLQHRPELTRVVTRELWDHWKQSGRSKRSLYRAAAEALSDGAKEDIADPVQAVQRHIERMLETGINDDAPRSGRPPMMNEAQTKRALKAFKNGYTVENVLGGQAIWFGFSSWEHALLENSPNSETLRRILIESGMNARSMFDALLRANGGKFRHIHIRYTHKLTDELRKERDKKAKEWAKLKEEMLYDVVWIDEKTEWVHGNRTYRCYAPDDATHIVRAGIMKFGEKKRIRFMSAASARLGPIYFAKVSGSSGYKTPFEVRT
jgi:hypothetical protein